MLVIIKFAETPKLVLWDSLETNYYGSKVASYFNSQFNGDIKPHITRKQSDGWRCGYFASFWYIYVHYALFTYQEGAYELLSDWKCETPPDGWEVFVLLLLKARDVTQNGDSSIHELGIAEGVMNSMSSGIIKLNELSGRVRKYITDRRID